MNVISRLRKSLLQGLLLFCVVSLTLPATAAGQTAALSARVSSLGFGADVGITVGENFGARVGLNAFAFSFDGEEDDVDYEFDVDLKTAALLADFYFSRIGFRVTAGGIINGNEANMLAEATDEIEIGDETYTVEDIGNLTGDVTFDDVAPYVGLGLDTSFGNRKSVGFVAEIGAMFHGKAQVSLAADGPIAADPDFQTNLELERSDVEDDLSDFTVYPVVAIGISYRF